MHTYDYDYVNRLEMREDGRRSYAQTIGTRQSEAAVTLAHVFFDALLPNVRGSTWHPQHEHAL